MSALRALRLLMGASLLAACDRPDGGQVVAQAAAPVPIESVAYDDDDLTPVTDPELVRELAPRAKAILDSHARAPFGSEFPFVHRGRRFVARVEEHEHPVGGPDKPWGPHRGVTVYEIAR